MAGDIHGFGCGPGGCVPLTQEQVGEIVKAADEAKAKRAADIPDEAAALRALFEAYVRLKEMGWRGATYAPRDGSALRLVECGSTGIHDGYRDAEGRFWITDGDTWPSRPVLFKLGLPEPPGAEGMEGGERDG